MTQNSEQQFVEMMAKSQGILHKVSAMYCRDPDDKKDLFQEILLQLWKAYPSFRQESKISTWIYQIALNTAISNFRKTSRQPQKIALEDYHLQLADSNYDTETEEKMAQLRLAIETLSDIEKALVMLYFEGKDNEEIADILGITANNVRVKMSRIRDKLRAVVQ